MTSAEGDAAEAFRKNSPPDPTEAAENPIVEATPENPDALASLGRILEDSGRLSEAADYYRATIARAPNHLEAHMGLGIAQQRLGDHQAAADAFRDAILLRPNYAAAHNDLAVALCDAGRLDEAISAFAAALALEPDRAEIHSNLGEALRDVGRLPEAEAAFQEALRLMPDNAEANAQSIHLRQLLCDWRSYEADWRTLRECVAQSRLVPPFTLLSWPSSCAEQAQAARRWAADLKAAPLPSPMSPRPERATKLGLGYLSGDLRGHAVGQLVSELLERHDASKFDVFCYSFGPDDDGPARRRLRAASAFVDIRGLGYADAARRIAADGVDILVDLQGFTKGARTQILACRPAPIQVNYLGYPGAMACDFIDYVIADPVVLPFSDQAHFTERIVHLPYCYQANDTTRHIDAPDAGRDAYGLPPNGFVFCCFNNGFKITPPVFDIWMRLLTAIPDSVLWLLDANETAKRHLMSQASSRGVAPDRLIFAPRMDLSKHLARHHHADLFLDSFPYGAHTTGSDALWAGLPVVTCQGETFASRVAASLVRAAGLPELVASSLEEYENLARALAASPTRLAALRQKLAANRTATPLFDMGRFTRDMEAAFARMHAIRMAGRAAESFAVADIAADV